VLFDKIKSGRYDDGDPVWEHISDGAKTLIAKMLDIDVRRRPSAADCLKDTWLTQQVAVMAAMPEGQIPVAAQSAATSQRQLKSVSRLLSNRSAQCSEVSGEGREHGSSKHAQAVAHRDYGPGNSPSVGGKMQAVPEGASVVARAGGPAQQAGMDKAERQGSDGDTHDDDDEDKDSGEFDQASYL
jgi:serine/threonine protein kinase